MRTYLVVIDGSAEAETALRFATRRAAKTGGRVEGLVIVAPNDFVAWGGVQEAMAGEALEIAEATVARALDMLGDDGRAAPAIKVRHGQPVALIHEAIAENTEIAALVLGAAASGNPGPLVSHFAGADVGTMPCPLMIVPGGLDRAALDRLS